MKYAEEDSLRDRGSSSYSHKDYTVGWICALPSDLSAAEAMLDEIHPALSFRPEDANPYVLGRISGHNVVLACMPLGMCGTTSAATTAGEMRFVFPSIRYWFLVGIGGGVPGRTADIRLGDVVVSKPTDRFPGVMQYDFGKTVQEGPQLQTGTLNKPHQVLLKAAAFLQADHKLGQIRMSHYLTEAAAKYPSFQFSDPIHLEDRLFEASYQHDRGKTNCDHCHLSELTPRSARSTTSPQIHYGLIASGNQVMKDAITRDKLGQRYGILCFEMEAAGLMDTLRCLVVKGICNYSDSHKNKEWQDYAAATASAYTKELLSIVPQTQVQSSVQAKLHEVADWLTPAMFDRQHKGISTEREPDTGLSLLKSNEYSR